MDYKVKEVIRIAIGILLALIGCIGIALMYSDKSSAEEPKTEIDFYKYSVTEEERKQNIEEEVLGVDYGDVQAECESFIFYTYESVGLDVNLQATIQEICSDFDISDALVFSIIEHESNYKIDAVNPSGENVGLCQISPRWFKKLAEQYGITDFMEPASNVTLACAYLKQLFEKYEEPELVLMCYSCGEARGCELWNSGCVTSYAKSVLARAQEIEHEK